MPDFAKLLKEAEDIKATHLSGGRGFKTSAEIQAKKSAEQAILDSIKERYALKDVVKAESHQDHLAFGKADLSYPGKVAIIGEGRAVLFDGTSLGSETRAKLARGDESFAIFHYGDKRFAKPLTDEYDRQDAIDDFSMGIQRSYQKAETRIMAGYGNDFSPLNKNGEVSESYLNTQKWVKETGWTDAREAAKIQVEQIIRERGLTPREIWPLRNDIRAEILVVRTLDNENAHGDDSNAVVALGFPDGSYQLQKDHVATQLEVGKTLDFKTNGQDGFERREIVDKTYYLSQNDDEKWTYHFTPDSERLNYGPFSSLDVTWDVLDLGNVEEHSYDLTEADKQRPRPMTGVMDERTRPKERNQNDQYYDGLEASQYMKPSRSR